MTSEWVSTVARDVCTRRHLKKKKDQIYTIVETLGEAINSAISGI